jgi:hypothetical protein
VQGCQCSRDGAGGVVDGQGVASKFGAGRTNVQVRDQGDVTRGEAGRIQVVRIIINPLIYVKLAVADLNSLYRAADNDND